MKKKVFRERYAEVSDAEIPFAEIEEVELVDPEGMNEETHQILKPKQRGRKKSDKSDK